MKIFIAFFLFFSFTPVFAACTWDNNSTVAWALDGCEPTHAITDSNKNYEINWGLKSKVVRITNQLIIAGSLLAVGAIVFAAVLYTMALGDAEKVKKAKNSLQFAVIGFAVMLLSYAIVNTIVNLVYGIR